MTTHNIDYELILGHMNQMIGILEYDSMRSAGKCKMNAPQLESMYSMKERYEKIVAAAPKPATKKEG